MICSKCQATIVENASYCPNCGETLTVQAEQNGKFCPSCGGEIKEGNMFCAKCGARTVSVTKADTYTTPYTNTSSSGKIAGSYFVSVISAIISFVIRIEKQEKFISWDNLLDNRKLVGIDSDLKPFLSVIPAIAAIIVSLLIASDKDASSQKKTIAVIVNIVFIILSILFIWFDIPQEII